MAKSVRFKALDHFMVARKEHSAKDERQVAQQAMAAKTARLRALRLAKEAQDNSEAKAAKPTRGRGAAKAR